MKRFHKIIISLVAALFLVIVLWGVNDFFGNPISHMLAKNAAASYLEEHFSDTDFVLGKVSYNFKFDTYMATVTSPSSIDSHFVIYTNKLGNKVTSDSYESDVTSKWNTWMRLETDYRALTDPIFKSLPYNVTIDFGELSKEANDFGFDPSTLIIDGIYDMKELGAMCGHLVLYITDTVTYERAAEILLAVRAAFDNAKVPFRSIDFTLDNGIKNFGDSESIYIADFAYDDITDSALAAKIAIAHEKLKAYYAEQDAEK